MDVTNVNSKEIEMHELVIVGSRYSKHLKDRLLPIYEKGEPMSVEELGRLLGGMSLVVRPVEDNTFDFHAVGARTEENLFLGFVWMYQSYALREWMTDQGVKCIKARIKRVNTKYGLIFAEVEGMTLKCQVRDSYNIDTNWASGLPRVLPYNNSMSLDVAMFLLHEALTENMDYEQLSSRFDNLLEYLPTDLSAHYYRECVELYHLMEQSSSEKVREMRDTLLHTFVNRGSTEKMEWWVKECLPRFISLAEDNNLLGLYKAANFTLERVEALLESAPNGLFYLYKYDHVHFAKQLYYLTLPNDVYNRLLTLLAVRELMQGVRTEDKQKLTKEILAKAVVDVQQYFWGFSSNAVLYCVRRDRYGYTGSASQCERELRELPYKGVVKYLCSEGTIANAFSHNPYMKYHIDKWEQHGVKVRALKLRDEFIKVIETALLLEKSAMKTAI